jgi:hypothetical protein
VFSAEKHWRTKGKQVWGISTPEICFGCVQRVWGIHLGWMMNAFNKFSRCNNNKTTNNNNDDDDDDDDDDDNTGSLGPPGTFGNLQETFTTKDIKTPHQNHENEASVDYQDHCTVVPVIGDTSKCTSQMSAF